MLNAVQLEALNETIRRVILQIGDREQRGHRALNLSGSTGGEWAKTLKILVDIKKEAEAQ